MEFMSVAYSWAAAAAALFAPVLLAAARRGGAELWCSARITRAVLAQRRIPTTITMWNRLGPQIAAITIISGTSGMTRK